MHYIRFLRFGDEIASLVFGQAGIHQRQDIIGLALGVKLLAGQGGRCFRAGVAAEMRWNIPVTKSILPFFARSYYCYGDEGFNSKGD